MAQRVFISHANQDSAFAERLAGDLRHCGADVWLDATHIGPGNFVQRINEALNARDVLVLVLTPNALASRWVPDEMDAALVRYKQGFMQAPIVVLAKPVPLRDIPALWTTYNRIDATSDYDRALPTIARALGLALPKSPPPAAPDGEPHAPGRAGMPTADAGSAASADRASASPGSMPPTRSSAQPVAGTSENTSSSAGPTLSRRSLLIGAGTVAVAGGGIGVLVKLMNLPGGRPSGDSPASGSPTAKGTSTPASGTMRWRFQTGGAVNCSAAVANGLVYFGSDDNSLYALDARTGHTRWNHRTGSQVRSTPVVANGLVYFGSSDEFVYALDANTGDRRWAYQTLASVISSPVIASGMVYISGGPDTVYALDAGTGAKRWSFQTVGNLPSDPAVANGLVYFGSTNEFVYALDANTGVQRWSYQTGGDVFRGPAVANGVVYIGSNDHRLYALDAMTGSKRWSFQTDNMVGSAPAVANGTVYFGSLDHNVYAVDASTGAKRWSFQAGDIVVSTPIVANELVYAGSHDHNVYALDASTGRKHWSYQTGDAIQFSAPTVANGVVYIGSQDGYLYAINA